MSVRYVPIGEVLQIADAEVSVDPEGTYPMVGVLGHGRGLLIRDAIRGTETSYKSLRRMSAGQVVYSRLKAFEGAFAVVNDETDGRYASSEFPNFDVDTARVHVGWLDHLLHTTWFAARITERSRGIGARRERLNVSDFLSVEIPLPDLDTQRCIAARLDSVGGSVNSALAVTNGQVAPDAVAPRVVARVLQDAQLPEVAVGELYSTISDVVHPGQDLRAASRFVGLEHIARHVGVATGQASTEDLKGRKLRFANDDVLYGYLRPYLNKVWVADGPGLCSVEQYVLRPTTGVDPRLLGHVLRSQATLDSVNAATHNLQLPRIRSGLLARIRVPDIRQAPPGLVDRLDSINARASAAAGLVARSRHLIASLLPAARNEEFRKLLDD